MAVRDPGTGPRCSVDGGRNAEFRPKTRPVWKDMYRPSAWKSCFVNAPNILMTPCRLAISRAARPIRGNPGTDPWRTDRRTKPDGAAQSRAGYAIGSRYQSLT